MSVDQNLLVISFENTKQYANSWKGVKLECQSLQIIQILWRWNIITFLYPGNFQFSFWRWNFCAIRAYILAYWKQQDLFLTTWTTNEGLAQSFMENNKDFHHHLCCIKYAKVSLNMYRFYFDSSKKCDVSVCCVTHKVTTGSHFQAKVMLNIIIHFRQKLC